MKEIIYIGDEFYKQSGTTMSPLYEAGTSRRYDFALMQRDLHAGEQIVIRQATPEEKTAKLAELALMLTNVILEFGKGVTQNG